MPNESSVPDWRLPTRLAFRFFVVYFALYVLATQMLSSLLLWPGEAEASLEFLSTRMVAWMGMHVFHVSAVPVESGSGDKLFDWVQAFCLVLLAIGGALIWSVLDRRR